MNRSGILQPEQPRKWYDKRRILQYPGGRNQMSETNIKRKQLFIFLLVAYGVTYLMGILMWYGSTASLGLSAFPNAQMMYPAAGVMLAYALTERGERKLTRWFYGIFLLMTVLMAVLAVLSVLAPESIIQLPGGEFTLWALVQQFVLIGGSLLCWIALLLDGKGRRKACGLGWRNWKPSLFCILLFLLLYFGRAGISYALTGQAGFLVETLTRPEAWSYLLFMPVNFILAFAAFFGEEYGWRYYLQPILQERFGVRTGVLILGVVWGLWHLPCDFFYYVTPDKGLIMTTSQIITCVTLGIFFAFAYMKTENIWVPVILHYMNNNLAPVIANTYSADVLENQEVTWGMVPASLVMNGLLFGFFLLAKEFRGRKVPE